MPRDAAAKRHPLPSLEEIDALDRNSLAHRYLDDRRRPPRFDVLVDVIRTSFPDLKVEVEDWSYEPFVKIGRIWRVTGRRRQGKRLTVRKVRSCFDQEKLFVHKTCETYRTNWDIVRWIGDEARRRKLV